MELATGVQGKVYTPSLLISEVMSMTTKWQINNVTRLMLVPLYLQLMKLFLPAWCPGGTPAWCPDGTPPELGQKFTLCSF